jgi:hypothetical protein
VRIEREARDTVSLQEALGLELGVLGFVPDAAQRHGRGHVAGGLEHAAEQYRHVGELRAGPLLDRGDHQMAEVRVR